jgi:type II secretory pathway component PulF
MLIVLLLGVLLVSPMVWIRLRRAEHRALVGAIVTGIEHGVPMPDMARAYAGEVAGGTGARARALATMLEAGVPLDAAVVRAPLWLGTGMHVAIRMGCAIGMLGPALTRELRSSREMEDLVQPLAPRLWYLSLVIALALSILTFVMLRIVPVFDRVFAGFELHLPAVTVQLIDVARGVADLGPVTVALVGPFLGTLLLATLAYIGILPRSLPVLDRLFRRYDGAIVLRSLSLAVKRGLPMPAAMALVGNVYPLRSVRRWLLAAADRAAGGVPWCDSLLATRLIGRSDAAVLRAAERAGNLAWAMEE